MSCLEFGFLCVWYWGQAQALSAAARSHGLVCNAAVIIAAAGVGLGSTARRRESVVAHLPTTEEENRAHVPVFQPGFRQRPEADRSGACARARTCAVRRAQPLLRCVT